MFTQTIGTGSNFVKILTKKYNVVEGKYSEDIELYIDRFSIVYICPYKDEPELFWVGLDSTGHAEEETAFLIGRRTMEQLVEGYTDLTDQSVEIN